MSKCYDFAALATNRIVIESRSESSTDLGGQSITWAAENTVWADIKPISGREVFLQDQLQSRVTHKMIIRYNATYKDTAEAAKRRISFDGQTFAIKYVRNLDDDLKTYGSAYQEIFCEDNGAENDS